MNLEKIKEILTTLLKELVEDGVHYIYTTISPREIINYKMNQLDGAMRTHRSTRADLKERIRNKRLFEEYLNEQGESGWELVTAFSYDRLPYNGVLVFRKLVIDLEDVEEIEFPMMSGDTIESLIDEYEEKFPEKNAIYRNELTKQFLEWTQERAQNED